MTIWAVALGPEILVLESAQERNSNTSEQTTIFFITVLIWVIDISMR